MTAQLLSRPSAVPPAGSSVLDRILTPGEPRPAANDTAARAASLLVRRRDRQRRRDAR